MTVKVETITIDLWGTLLFDGPTSDNRYKKRRLTDFERLLAAAGLPVSTAALDRAYEESGAYLGRIWATHRDAEPSVLIEESAWPLTAPSWRPIGRSIVFGRFVPESMESHQPAPRGGPSRSPA